MDLVTSLGNAAVSGLQFSGQVAMAVGGAAGGAMSAGVGAMSRGLGGEASFFDESVTDAKIKHLLDNVDTSGKSSLTDKVEGMKYILAQMARGRDASVFYPDVVKNVINKAVELKKLVYSYLVGYADFNDGCRELALLSINSFLRDLNDSNQLIRGMALRVLASIRVREVVQVQLTSLKKCAADSSPYVRKTSAHACGKIFQTDPDAKEEVCEAISALLGDKNTQVLSSALAAFTEVCPEDLALLHPHYRKLCCLLADLDDWGQIVGMNVLGRYARAFFARPAEDAAVEAAGAAGGAQKPKKDFYEEDDEEDEDEEDEDEEEEDEEEEDAAAAATKAGAVPEDLALLLRVATPLLRSRNSGVVLAVASLFSSVGGWDAGALPKVGRALVRVCRGAREIQYVVLGNVVALAKASPGMFRPFLSDFYVAESEPAFVRLMKVDVLAALACLENASAVLREFTRYVKDMDKDFVRHAIAGIVRIANAVPAVADKCLKGLMGLVLSDNEGVVATGVVAIRQLLQQHSHHDALTVTLIRRLDKITSPSARAAIVWILGEFQYKPKVAALAPDMLRRLAKTFVGEAGEVKAQIVNLAAKTFLYNPGSKQVALLLNYCLDLARYDSDYDLRDRARLLRYLVLGTEVTQLDASALEEAGTAIALPRKGTEGVEVLAAETEAAAADAAAAVAAAAAAGGEGGSGEGGAAAAAAEGEGGASAAPAEGAGAAAARPASPTLPSGGSSSPSSSSSGGGGGGGAAAVKVKLAERMTALLLAAKPPPAIHSALESAGGLSYSMGSLSNLVGHSAKGYVATPEWAAENSKPSLRDPPPEEERKASGGASKGGKKTFDEDEEDSEEDDEDEDDEDEDSDSEEEEDEDDDEEDDEEDEDEDSDEEDEDSEEEDESEDD